MVVCRYGMERFVGDRCIVVGEKYCVFYGIVMCFWWCKNFWFCYCFGCYFFNFGFSFVCCFYFMFFLEKKVEKEERVSYIECGIGDNE